MSDPRNKVEIMFDSPEAAEHFIAWLSGSGEQQYWDWMMVREEEEDGNITAVNFDYWGGTEDGNQFGKHPVIAKCGRLNK